MIKIKPLLLFLVVFGMWLVGCVAHSQPISSGTTHPETVAEASSQRDLAIALLTASGISQQYNLYLGNSVYSVVPSETARNDKFMAWMQDLFVREAGWSHVEAEYIAQLEANFSAVELQELLDLARQPLMQKLLQTEMKAYVESAGERHRRLSELWDDYNSGRFTPPPEVFQ